MKRNIFYRQMRRSAKNAAANGLILLVVTAFFVMSLNLYVSSSANLQQAEETYRTIAVIELYGDVDRTGTLIDATSEDYVGYLSVAVEGYDLDKIVGATGVVDYDLRARYAAYIENCPAKSDLNPELVGQNFMNDSNIIRFTLAQDEPVTIPISWSEDYQSYNRNFPNTVFLDVSESAADFLWYKNTEFHSRGINLKSLDLTADYRGFFAESVRQLNRNNDLDHVTLYPGVEYIAFTRLMHGWKITDDSQGKYVGAQELYPTFSEFFTQDYYVGYTRKNIEYADYRNGIEAGQPFPIARWEDVQNDPELKSTWQAAWDAVEYNMCAYNVCLTDDITGVPVFHLGGAFLSDGRVITAEEYERGAKVCMVSKKMAQYHGWRVGSKLDMDFFQFDAFPNRVETQFHSSPIYHKGTKGFFDSGKYEVVGIYDQRTLEGNSSIAPSTLSMPWNLIYVPHNSVQNTLPEDQLRVHASLLTFWLENGSIDAFLSDIEALGLSEKKADQYYPSFTFYDQGFSTIQPGLLGMHGTAKLLLILSLLLLTVTCVLLAWFYAQRQKHNIGIFRMLGGKKHRAVTAVLVCALVIALLGAIPGAVLGHRLSARVGETLLPEDPEQNEQLSALRAYVLAPEESETMEIVLQADKKLSAAACCGALLFPLLTLVFVGGYIGSEPRSLLPQNKD